MMTEAPRIVRTMPLDEFPRPDDGVPRCKCNLPSEGLIRTDKVRIRGRVKDVPTYWDSACMAEIKAVAFTDPHLVRVHSRNGLLTWEQFVAQDPVKACSCSNTETVHDTECPVAVLA